MSVVNPVKEMGLLRETKEILDELQILGDLFKDELKVLRLAVDKGVLVAVGKRPENTPSAWKELISLVTSRWEEVQEMIRDATRASQSVSLAKAGNRTCSASQLTIANCLAIQLNDLIDLKQKFSNILEARWSRTMAEEASRQAEETARQGTTLMVFTSVTIVFLPVSFMAAFFALDVAQFPRNESDQLDLGTVSQYIFLISAVVVAPLLFIAFNVTRLSSLRETAKTKILDSSAQAFRPASTLRPSGESASEDLDSMDTNDSDDNDGSKDTPAPPVKLRLALVWDLLVVPMNEVRCACLKLLKATDKLHIKSTSNPPAENKSSKTSSLSSEYMSYDQRPTVRPGIKLFLSFTKHALRMCLLPFWLLILCLDVFVGGVIYLVSWLVMYPNPLAERVNTLFESAMFSFRREQNDSESDGDSSSSI
ncbi:hypothetical protein V8F33_004965 [Rhypophila sp. PSN 637]